MISASVQAAKAILVNGIKIVYTTQGNPDSHPLIFIHGLAENRDAWTKNMAGLSAEYFCIALDLPGHGASQSGDYPYTPYFFTETITSLIKQLGIDHVIVAGHSMGGQIAIMLSIAQPVLVQKLILISPAGFEIFDEADQRWIREQSKKYSSQLQGFDFLKIWPNYKSPTNEVYQTTVDGMLKQPVFDHLSSISQPVLIIFGEGDPFIPNRFIHPKLTVKQVAESGAKHIKNAKLVMIPNAGHFVNVERAEAVNTAIKDFIQK